MKKISTIPFLELESIPLLIKDFLNAQIPGFEQHIFTPENIEAQFHKKGQSFSTEKRELLFSVLREQHSLTGLSEKQHANLNDLKQPQTFTVTTGHQLNLFTGPVFFIYKILQTIKLAEYLNEKFPERKTVPLFWMATEDHDFEEINHFRTENSYYETHANAGGAVGRIKVSDDRFTADFENEFRDSVFGTELVLLIKKAYAKGNTLSVATRILVQELFAEYGLLILDGDCAELKAEMKTAFKNELSKQELFNESKETVSFLTDKYGKVQVNPREINLFYLSETRDRIEFAHGKYQIVDKDISFTEDEILRELANHPERFSPNALMRPVYQETILPNLAYIGGNAEIMYWLELRKYFEATNLPFPILIPRNSMLFLTQKILDNSVKLGLGIPDFFRNFTSVSKDVLLENNQILAELDQAEETLSTQFANLTSAAEKTDQTFGNLVDAEKTRQLKSFKRMRKRLLRAEKIKQNEKLARLEDLFLKVHPGKVWQERAYNFSVFYSDFGKEWLQNCFEGLNVQNSELSIFVI
ncbi:bacillithiol biosynthesis cysteine-adding enzyme BshC [Kaistella palustris]|uniref:bacillithiol biosynthesis cysteine-adding enzyme BshC n=1 Tax=Kaistella palustris TaxID=493376 RepID=UPI00040F1565|nr:bacillithiol biosynthesis cysteine-adding enzyme BshC [Kaistella palustris]